jgi:hypothetical protein
MSRLTEGEVREIAEYLAVASKSASMSAEAIHAGALEASPLSDGSEREEIYMAQLQKDYARRAEELRIRLWEAHDGGSR